ncbi:MAG: mechanosensitive ion channel family protein [Brevefilum sp.]|nr:mechanosensitive ion channel family protein [Brevefilum sp.]MDT8382573.1 mechanosensitive ion channel family protein [Brevefilum sp.]MDW7754646.1 mechanosensitive ion channel family protein [Brevefilum sp.]
MEIQQAFQEWFTSLVQLLPNLITAIVIFFVTILASDFLAKGVKRIAKKKIENHEMLHLIFLLTRWTVIIFGTIFALSQVNFDVTGFIAGLGVAGFTIGFALQDIAKNFISGLLLLSRQPFSIGDYVKVNDYNGNVKEINVRDTVVETLDGEIVIIPNQKVFENPIINYTQSRLRRRTVVIGLGYEEDVARATQIFLDVIKNVPGVESQPEPSIRAKELGDSALTLEALFWVDQQSNNLVGIHSDVVTAIKEASDKHNINLPYPVQTVLLQNVNGK